MAEGEAEMSEAGVQDGRALGRLLVDTFGKGWEKGNPDLIMSVFTPDIVFLETPFEEPKRGQEEVRDYWKDVPLHQSEVRFRSGEIFAVGPWFATEFKCVFRRRRTGEWVEVRGALFCETVGELIGEMRMYWHRR
jgi:hypothetical protein